MGKLYCVGEVKDAKSYHWLMLGIKPGVWTVGSQFGRACPVFAALTLCDEFGLQPTVFYRWQKEFFENGAAAFQTKARSDHQAEKDRIEFLEKKIQRKDEVLAELMSEHIALKKELGEL